MLWPLLLSLYCRDYYQYQLLIWLLILLILLLLLLLSSLLLYANHNYHFYRYNYYFFFYSHADLDMALDVKIIIVHRCYLLLCFNRTPYRALINKSQFRYKAIHVGIYIIAIFRMQYMYIEIRVCYYCWDNFQLHDHHLFLVHELKFHVQLPFNILTFQGSLLVIFKRVYKANIYARYKSQYICAMTI